MPSASEGQGVEFMGRTAGGETMQPIQKATLFSTRELWANMLLGIQCAATTTRLCLATNAGHIKWVRSFPAASISIQRSPVDELRKIFGFLDTHGGELSWDQESVRAVACGVSGLKEHSKRVTSLTELLKLSFPFAEERIAVEEDVWFDLFGSGKQYGFAFLLSTGANFAFRSMQSRFNVGGHGSELSDRGGGYFIGRRALMSLLDFRDRRRMVSPNFCKKICEYVAIPSVSYVTEWHEELRETRDWRRTISDIAIAVVQLSEEENDATATEIIEYACAEINRSVLSLFLTLRNQKIAIPLECWQFMLCGGLALNSRTISRRLRSDISSYSYLLEECIGMNRSEIPSPMVHESTAETVVGCLFAAERMLFPHRTSVFRDWEQGLSLSMRRELVKRAS